MATHAAEAVEAGALAPSAPEGGADLPETPEEKAQREGART